MQTLRVYVTTELLRSGTSMLDMFESVAALIFSRFEESGPMRAVNPSAILVDQKGKAYDIDFENDFFNPHYVSPEEVGGAEPTFKTMVYNLGAIFYFIATQSDPYGPYSPGTPPDAHFMRKLTDPHRINPEISNEVTAMIKKMMAESLGIRHKNVKSFRLDMDNIKRGEWPLNAPVTIDFSDEKAPPAESSTREVSNKKKISVSNERISELRSKQMRSLRKPRMGFVYFLLLVGIGYFAWQYHVKDNWEEYKAVILDFIPQEVIDSRTKKPAQQLQAESPGRDTRPAPRQSRPDRDERLEYRPQNRPSRQDQRQPPREERQSRSGTWRDPEFIRAARTFNAAVDRYTEYTQSVESGHPNPRLLDGVEDALRSAIDGFQQCRPRAPDDVPIKDYIDRCYRLIANVRQSMLLQRASPGNQRR